MKSFPTRRKFLTSGSLLAGAMAFAKPRRASAADEIRVGLIGCGGRGTGAASHILETYEGARLFAMADLFEPKIKASVEALQNKHSARVDCPPERQFIGLDAAKAVMERVDVVVLATPPAFRPQHFEEAVLAGKHVFLEKTIAVDAPGLRRIQAASQMAKQKGLTCVVGYNRRFQKGYQEAIRRIQEDQMLGAVSHMEATWHSSGLWVRDREPDMTELESQLHNWAHFAWLSGEICLDQISHNLDVCLWAKGAAPVKVKASCGRRQKQPESRLGDNCDFFVADFDFEDGSTMKASVRHWKDASNKVGETIAGDRGSADFTGSRHLITNSAGNPVWAYRAPSGNADNPYLTEQQVLMDSILNFKQFNNVEESVQSEFAVVMMRLAAYSGRTVTWEEALRSQERLAPETISADMPPPTLPTKYGDYPVPARFLPS